MLEAPPAESEESKTAAFMYTGWETLEDSNNDVREHREFEMRGSDEASGTDAALPRTNG